ncbi:MAG: ATP-binding cassette domain-containing protein [Armatimonadetes bacterium]|nr:ATP-binding cassette domain-containing protein [Armatimonadota bacterium]
MPTVIVADNLTKTYILNKKAPGVAGALKALFRPDKVRIEAVKQVSFTIAEGELVGFIGPNGAGKTTTLKMLTGILFATGGRADVLGFDPSERRREMQRQIALVMGNKMQLWWDLPAWESFLVLKEIYEVSDAEFKIRIDELVSILDLSEKLHTQVRRLSLGERMKCELIAALLHGPRVLFLDEPTLGLDVVSQKRIREFLKRHNREHRTTILLTSHYMQDVAELCERVIVIDHGSLIFDGSLTSLTERFGPVRRLHLIFRSPVHADMSAFGRVLSSSDTEVVLEVPREQTSAAAAKILEQFPVKDIAIEDIAIEDVVRELFTREPDTLPAG